MATRHQFIIISCVHVSFPALQEFVDTSVKKLRIIRRVVLINRVSGIASVDVGCKVGLISRAL